MIVQKEYSHEEVKPISALQQALKGTTHKNFSKRRDSLEAVNVLLKPVKSLDEGTISQVLNAVEQNIAFPNGRVQESALQLAEILLDQYDAQVNGEQKVFLGRSIMAHIPGNTAFKVEMMRVEKAMVAKFDGMVLLSILEESLKSQNPAVRDASASMLDKTVKKLKAGELVSGQCRTHLESCLTILKEMDDVTRVNEIEAYMKKQKQRLDEEIMRESEKKQMTKEEKEMQKVLAQRRRIQQQRAEARQRKSFQSRWQARDRQEQYLMHMMKSGI